MSKYISLEEFCNQHSGGKKSKSKVEKCAYCHQPLDGISFDVKGKKICASCYEKNKAKYEKRKADRADKALKVDIEFEELNDKELSKVRELDKKHENKEYE